MSTLKSVKIGQRLKELRRQRKITQERLAELTGTSYKYLQRIEGKTPPDIRLSTILKLSKALKVKPADIIS